MNLGLIIKGFVVGVGKIIPGVSGAMLAMFMGIYEELMDNGVFFPFVFIYCICVLSHFT